MHGSDRLEDTARYPIAVGVLWCGRDAAIATDESVDATIAADKDACAKEVPDAT